MLDPQVPIFRELVEQQGVLPALDGENLRANALGGNTLSALK